MDTEHKFDFEAVLGRIKQAMHFTTDAQVADFIGMSPSGLGNRKRAGSIPFENICTACASRGVNIEWVLTGDDGARAGKVFEVPCMDLYEPNLMSEITREVWIAFEDKGYAENEPAILATAGFRAALATLIYNRVHLENSPKHRTAMIREEAVIFAYADKFRANVADGSSARVDLLDLPEGSEGSEGSA